MTLKFSRFDSRRGFSLIEVMVAVSIFSMLIVMMAALFQQSSNAWRGGGDQAKGFMTMRATVGALQRDMVNMIDEAYLKRVIGAKTLDKPINIPAGSASSLSFYMLRPTTARDSSDKVVKVRGYSHVSWTLGARSTRVETLYPVSGSPLTVSTTFGDATASRINGIQVSGVQTDSLGSGTTQPAAVYKIRVDMRTRSENTYDIGAISFGPDGTETKNESQYGSPEDDDIRTWTKKK